MKSLFKTLSPYHNRVALYVILICALFAVGVYTYYHSQYAKDLLLLTDTFNRIVEPVRQILLPSKQEPKTIRGAYLDLNSDSSVYPVQVEESTVVFLRTTDTLALLEDDIQIAGVDIAVKYDPDMIEVIDVIPVSSSFTIVPAKNIDSKEGIILLSLLTPPQKYGQITDQGEALAEIQWKAKKEASAELLFEFTPGLTTDTNVAEFGTGKDVLIEVANAQYEIVREL